MLWIEDHAPYLHTFTTLCGPSPSVNLALSDGDFFHCLEPKSRKFFFTIGRACLKEDGHIRALCFLKIYANSLFDSLLGFFFGGACIADQQRKMEKGSYFGLRVFIELVWVRVARRIGACLRR